MTGTPVTGTPTPTTVTTSATTIGGTITATSVKPGYKTTEFWLTLVFVVLAHVASALKGSPGLAGVIGAFIADAIAVTGYSVSRGLVKGASK